MAEARHPHRIITRLVDGGVCAYDLAGEERGPLSPVLVRPPAPGDDIVGHAVAADLQRVYYTTQNAVVCVTPDGVEVWRSGLEPESSGRYGHAPGCVLSPDERVLWVYRPDAMAGRDRPDQWVALDARSGAVVAQADLRTAGHGGVQLPHRPSGQILLNVGEGQDGTAVYRASLTEAGMDLFQYPWDDRCLIDLSPDGHRFMTVNHDQGDITIHAYPGGEAVFTLPVDAFGHNPDEAWVEWSGGHLSPDTVVVTVVGESEDGEEWFRHYRVDARSGRVHAEFDARGEDPYDIHPLGDGTWLTTDPSGHPVRWTDS
ncbi:hypothetical protein ACIPYS_09045 [Kitasatospora sp. NPDC089913]|uniref:hypothetical protein n=1 Tax=Streptomycetaceae TaxID=2062 RepID=UPI00087CAB6C|nr:hypothetical protein [Streptomyces sp. TLI_053]SDS66902.1 hypothetical protein SAMN05216371_0378 [Streptomyces sp. TLI_053]